VCLELIEKDGTWERVGADWGKASMSNDTQQPMGLARWKAKVMKKTRTQKGAVKTTEKKTKKPGCTCPLYQEGETDC